MSSITGKKIFIDTLIHNSNNLEVSITIGTVREKIGISSTPEKKKAIVALLNDYTTSTTSHSSQGNSERAKLNASRRTTYPTKEGLVLGTEYMHSGERYNSIKQNNTRFGAMINGVWHTVVLENRNRLTMVPDSWLG